MQSEQILQLCRCPQAPSLAAWLGEPLSVNQAEAGLALLRELSRESCGLGQICFNRHLVQMIARYWLDPGAEMDYQNLAATVANSRDKAQLELVYGQLLIARKIEMAWKHLDAGFNAAANLLQPTEYFMVLHRHEDLRLLPLSPIAVPGKGLDDLLTEARVIRRLQGRISAGGQVESQHQDTVD